MTFGEQRHRQKNGRRGGCKLDSELHIAVWTKTPFQGTTGVVQRGKMRGSLGAGLQRRPFAAGLLEPSPIVRRMARRQLGRFGLIDRNAENVRARRIKKPIAHHGA